MFSFKENKKEGTMRDIEAAIQRTDAQRINGMLCEILGLSRKSANGGTKNV